MTRHLTSVATQPLATPTADATYQHEWLNPCHDHHRMPSIWQLVAGNYAAMGDVKPEDAMAAAHDGVFDRHSHTRVVQIKHESGRLAGTFSVTLDSDDGMPITRHFHNDLTFLRRKYRLVNGWRFSMSPLYQSAALRQRTFALFKHFAHCNDADAFVIYFNERLTGYYNRQFNGRVIAQKSISFDGQKQLPVNLMLCHTADNVPNPKYLSAGDSHEDAMVI